MYYYSEVPISRTALLNVLFGKILLNVPYDLHLNSTFNRNCWILLYKLHTISPYMSLTCNMKREPNDGALPYSRTTKVPL